MEDSVHAKLGNRVIGEELGKYRVLAPIGKGGMAAVYVGEHTLLGNRVAIKVLQKRHLDNEAIKRRFFNEAKVIAAIRHSNIVEIFDYGRSDSGAAFIVMELLEGQTLRERIRRGVMPERQSGLFMRQLASGLSEAHRQGVIHRDLKPDNVFIIADEEVEQGERIKLLDFGIAKRIESDAGLGPPSEQTATGILVGTPAYMSPEQCKGLGTIDGRSDIYSLGVVLYRMLTNQLPFEAGGTGELIGKHLFVEPPSPREVNPQLSSEIEAVVLRCLQKEPEHRYQSMAELAAALGHLISENTLVRSRPVQLSPQAHQPIPNSTPSGLAYGQHLSPVNEVADPRGYGEAIESSGPTTLGSATGQQQIYQQGQVRNRRWSLVVAGGCVAAMVIGVVALSAGDGASGNDASAADGSATQVGELATEVGESTANDEFAKRPTVGDSTAADPHAVESSLKTDVLETKAAPREGVSAETSDETSAKTSAKTSDETSAKTSDETSAKSKKTSEGTPSQGAPSQGATRNRSDKSDGQRKSGRTKSKSKSKSNRSPSSSTAPDSKQTSADTDESTSTTTLETGDSKTENLKKQDPEKTYDDVKPKMLY